MCKSLGHLFIYQSLPKAYTTQNEDVDYVPRGQGPMQGQICNLPQLHAAYPSFHSLLPEKKKS